MAVDAAIVGVTAEWLVSSINGLVESHPSLSREWVGLILLPIVCPLSSLSPLSSFLPKTKHGRPREGDWTKSEGERKLKPRSETQQNISQLYQYL